MSSMLPLRNYVSTYREAAWRASSNIQAVTREVQHQWDTMMEPSETTQRTAAAHCQHHCSHTPALCTSPPPAVRLRLPITPSAEYPPMLTAPLAQPDRLLGGSAKLSSQISWTARGWRHGCLGCTGPHPLSREPADGRAPARAQLDHRRRRGGCPAVPRAYLSHGALRQPRRE
eukprot:scaffold17559_cov110-Isochrysis_galbana.AAC.9